MLTVPLIKEESQIYKKHDLLYKELIHTFFKEFLEVFFTEIHNSLDFQTIKPISEEVHTDIIDGQTRRLDIVIETKLKDTNVLVIVHVEPQSSVQRDFHERMFHYYSLLYNKYRKPIIPIAVFSYGEKWEKATYTMELPFFHVLTFNYKVLHLKKKNWREYIHSDNPAAAALLSEMGYKDEERVDVKKEFLRMITRMQLDSAKQRLIYGFFESYLPLTEEEEEKLMKEVEKLPEAERILELPISYEEKGKKIGKHEVAIEMLKEESDIKFISKVTKLTEEEINELRKKI